MEMRQSVVTIPSRQGGAMQANDRKETGLCDHAAVMRQASIGTANTGRRRRKAEMTPGISASAGRKNEGEIFFQRGLFRGRAVPPERGQPGTETGTEFRQVLTGFTGDSQKA